MGCQCNSKGRITCVWGPKGPHGQTRPVSTASAILPSLTEPCPPWGQAWAEIGWQPMECMDGSVPQKGSCCHSVFWRSLWTCHWPQALSPHWAHWLWAQVETAPSLGQNPAKQRPRVCAFECWWAGLGIGFEPSLLWSTEWTASFLPWVTCIRAVGIQALATRRALSWRSIVLSFPRGLHQSCWGACAFCMGLGWARVEGQPHCCRTLTRKGAQPNCSAKGDRGWEHRRKRSPSQACWPPGLPGCQFLGHVSSSWDLW